MQHAQQLEARLALRLQEAAQRRIIHLDQIRERAAISKEEKEACPPMSPPKRGLRPERCSDVRWAHSSTLLCLERSHKFLTLLFTVETSILYVSMMMPADKCNMLTLLDLTLVHGLAMFVCTMVAAQQSQMVH